MISRKNTHGDYYNNLELISKIQTLILEHGTKELLKDLKTRATLDHIIFKLVRIITGDKDFLDHWDDISGYAMLKSNIIKKGRK